MFSSSIKGINRLLSKGIFNIHLKVTIDKNWRSQNFDFLSLKNLSPGEFLRSYKSCRYWTLKLLATLKSDDWEENLMWIFCYFNFERNYDILKSNSPCILLNKNINFNGNETESKMENLTHSCRETNLVFQLI